VALSPRAAWVRALGPQAPVIVQSAESHGVDPYVALAVASGEGGFKNPTKVGDHGTSFGPFQLHSGGALPAPYWGNPQAANRFANSPAGIDYAMTRIHAATRGKSGPAAIAAAVKDFERPANPQPEVQHDTAFYNSLTHGRVTPPLAGPGIQPLATAAAGATQGSTPPGVSGKTVGNVFASCKVIGAGPGGGLPVVGGAVGTFTGFLSGQTEGGILCYVTGVLKISAMAFAGVALMGAGFYLMLPRGGRQKVNKLTFGTAEAIATKGQSLAPKTRARAAARSRRTHAERKRVASTSVAETRAAEAPKQERAKTSASRARAREARSKATQAKYNTPSRMGLSQRTEDQITRAKANPRRGRPDRVA